MLERRPQEPTTRMTWGCETSWGSTKRWMASRKMDRHSATRKTPLISAPRVSARCHCLLSGYGRTQPTGDAHPICVCLGIGLLAGHLDCPQSDEKRYDIIQLCLLLACTLRKQPATVYAPCGTSRPPAPGNALHIPQSTRQRKRPCLCPRGS